MLVHRRAAALFLAVAAVGHISSGSSSSGGGGVGVLASSAPGGATGNGQYRPPPPPPPPSSGGSSAAASANNKKGDRDDGVSAGGNAVKMPPPPPPPPRSRQQQLDDEMTTSTRTSAPQYLRMPPPPPPLRQQLQQQQGRINSNQSSLGSRPANAGTGTAAAAGTTAGGATFSANLNAAVTMSNVGQEEREEMFQGQLQREAQGGARSAASDTVRSPSAGEDAKDESSGTQEASSTEQSGNSNYGRPSDQNSEDSSREHVQGHQEQRNLQGYGGHDNGEQQYDAQQHHRQEQTGWAQHSQSQGYEDFYYNQQRQAQKQQQQQDQYYTQQQQREDGSPQPSSPPTTDDDPSSGRMVPYQRQYAQQQQQQHQHYMQQQAHGGMRQPPPGMQHRRPPPPGYHPEQNQGPNMFNGFMRRLEKGMDAVASLEDMVDKRARALGRTVKYATAGKMSVKEAVAASVAGSREGLRKIQRAERRRAQAPNMFDLFKDDIEAAEAQVEQAEKQAAAADGNIGGSMRGGDAVGGAAPWDGPQIGGPNDMATSMLSGGEATTGPSPISVQSGGHGDASSASLEQSSNPIEQLLGPPSSPSGPVVSSSSVPDGHDRISSRPSRVVKDDDDDDDWSDDSSKGEPLSKLFSFMPSPASFIPTFRRKDSLLDLDDWSDGDDDWDTAASKRTSTPPASVRRNTRGMAQAQAADGGVPLPVAQLLGRGDSRTGESGFNLLSKQERYQCHRLGRTRSLFDVAALVFFVVAIHELSPFIATAINDASTTVFQGRDGDIPIVGDIQGGKKLLSALYTAFASSCKDSWAPLALASTILSIWSNDVFVRPAVRRSASAVTKNVRDQASSSQMFLRLVAGLPPRKAMPEVLAQSARRQVWSDVEASRLRSFIAMSTIALIALTVSVAKPIVGSIVRAGVDIASLEGWKWPLEWAALGPGMKSHLRVMAKTIGALLGEEWAKVVENPLAVVVQVSLFVVLFAISTLPTIVRHIEQKKSASDILDIDAAVKIPGDDDEEYDSERSTAAVLDMGVSSATRLSLLSQQGAVEGALQRWKLMQPAKSSPSSRSSESRISDITRNRGGAGPFFRRVAYEASVLALLCLPVALFVVISPSVSVDASERWNTGSRLVSLLLVTFSIARRSLSSMADEFMLTSAVDSFLKLLSATAAELTKSNQEPQADLQLAAQASPDKGIIVSDFWAAHAQRRAWACQGAQLSCKNGEVCLVLGDDGSGKSRLLTALAETLVSPPTKSRSTVFVRGQINVGGVDVTRWDKKKLKRNLGLVLNDVRTLSDTAELFSGLTLLEILDPTNGSGGGPGSPSHNAMNIALQVTGLSSLVAHLPSKLSTVVTANEDELSPSPTRPSAQILSPSEWSKVLLSRAIAQAVFGNDNPMTSPDAVQRSLVGSLLLLDDVTAHANEIEEATLIKALRATGAATLLTSNHWASGRHANKVVVIKDGAVVESGTHAELMQRGPAHSLYALRWKQMTTGV